MWKFRQVTLCLTIAALTLAGVAGCQSGSRFAMFGKPKPAVEAAKKNSPTATTVSHTEMAENRLEDSFYESVEASRLDGTSISHLPPGRVPKKERKGREPGPTRPQGSVPGGAGGGTPMY